MAPRRKVKPFIDRKAADTYRVVSRSRADPNLDYYDDVSNQQQQSSSTTSTSSNRQGGNVLVPVRLGASAQDAPVLPDEAFEDEDLHSFQHNKGPHDDDGVDVHDDDGGIRLKQGGNAASLGYLTNPFLTGNNGPLKALTAAQEAELAEIRAQLDAGELAEDEEEAVERAADALEQHQQRYLQQQDDIAAAREQLPLAERALFDEVVARREARLAAVGVLDADAPEAGDASIALADDFVSQAMGGALMARKVGSALDADVLGDDYDYEGDGGADLDLDGLEGDNDDSAAAGGRRRVHFASDSHDAAGRSARGLDGLDDLEGELPDWSEIGAAASASALRDPNSLRALMDQRFERLVGREYDEQDVGGLSDEEGSDFEDHEGGDMFDDGEELHADGTGAPPMAQFSDIFDEFLEEHTSKVARSAIAEQARRDREREMGRGGDSAGDSSAAAAAVADELGVRRRERAFQRRNRIAKNPDELAPEDRARLRDQIVRLDRARQEDPRAKAIVPIQIAAPRQQERWDAESIISTYSNLDNHPHIVAAPTTRKQQKAREQRKRRRGGTSDAASMPDAVDQIVLSRHGVPLGVLPDGNSAPMKRSRGAAVGAPESGDEDMAGGGAAGNLGISRDRDETAEEKKLRKAAVKEQKRASRQRKSNLKHAFKREEAKQKQSRVSHPVTTVLKI